MWIILSVLAAFFSGLNTFFIKKCIDKLNIKLTLLIRTFIILLIYLLIFKDIIFKYNIKTILFLFYSSISTLLMWYFNFKALKVGNVINSSAIDKSSIIITLLLSYFLLNEKITIIKIISIIFIFIGCLLCSKNDKKINKKCIIFSILTALFSSMSTIFIKIGLSKINAQTAALYRTIIMFIILFILNNNKYEKINKKDFIYIIISSIFTSLSWIFYFKAIKIGNVTIVFALEKLSLLFSIILSTFFLKEKLSRKNVIGIIMILFGSFILIK